MGNGRYSKESNRLHPQKQPMALLRTSDGIVARVNDPQTGGLKYTHNPRNIPMLMLKHEGADLSTIRIPALRAGKSNQEMQKNIIYIKRRCINDTNNNIN
jgi:hypothetical protein